MRSWRVQDAKARFSELLYLCMSEGAQLVTRRGADAAVLVPVKEWRRLQNLGRSSLKDMLLSDSARGDFDIPERGQP